MNKVWRKRKGGVYDLLKRIHVAGGARKTYVHPLRREEDCPLNSL